MDGGHRARSSADDHGDRRLTEENAALRKEVKELRADLVRTLRARDRLSEERDAVERDRETQARDAAEIHSWRATLEGSRRFRLLRALGLLPLHGGRLGHWKRRTLDIAYALFVRLCPEGSRRKGLIRGLVGPLLARRRPAHTRAETPPVVSLVATWPECRDSLAALVGCVHRQTYAHTELLLVIAGDAADCRAALDESRVRGLTWSGATEEDALAHLTFVSGEWLFEVDAPDECSSELVAELLDQTRQNPRLTHVAGPGGRLRANPRWGASARAADGGRSIAIEPGLTELEGAVPWAERQDADIVLQSLATAVEVEGREATALLVGTDADAAYQWRLEFSGPRRVAVTTDRLTADRLRYLAPRTLSADSVESIAATLLERRSNAVREVGEEPGLEPFTADRTCRVAIQVDDFREGGMETVIMDLAESLTPHGFSCCLLILGETGPAAEDAKRLGLEIYQMTPASAVYSAFLRDQKIELVNAHFSTFGADLCGRAGIPFVQNVHNMYMWFGAAEAERFRVADPHTQAYVCVSKNVARYSDVKLRLAPSKMVVIPNGCDPAHMDSEENRARGADIRTELGLDADDRMFLTVASIHPIKGQVVLVEALGAIARECPKAHVVLIGRCLEDDYGVRLDRAIEESGLDGRVHILGHRRDVSAFYAAADAVVMPSIFEGWSLAITEAVLAGVPVISTDVGGAADQLRGTTGVVVPPVYSDLRGVDGQRLKELLTSRQLDVRDRIADAMREVYGRGGERSPLPDHWEAFTRHVAYSRYAHVFRWLVAGGSAAACAYWTEPLLDLGFPDRGTDESVVLPQP